jgi:hypothetical protein
MSSFIDLNPIIQGFLATSFMHVAKLKDIINNKTIKQLMITARERITIGYEIYRKQLEQAVF